MTLSDLSGSDSETRSPRMAGTTCHDTPNLSLSHPHWSVCPPRDRFSQNSSISFCVSQFTTKEMASVGLKWGPPFSATNSCPSMRNLTVMTLPSGRPDASAPAFPYRAMAAILEFLKIET